MALTMALTMVPTVSMWGVGPNLLELLLFLPTVSHIFPSMARCTGATLQTCRVQLQLSISQPRALIVPRSLLGAGSQACDFSCLRVLLEAEIYVDLATCLATCQPAIKQPSTIVNQSSSSYEPEVSVEPVINQVST